MAAIRQPRWAQPSALRVVQQAAATARSCPWRTSNLHLTGDIHAIGVAHNLCAAAIDARIYHESRWSDAFFERQGLRKLHIDPYSVTWNRVVDMNDRTVRNVIVGLGDKADGPVRQTGFDITVSSELMAILALSTSLDDMRERIGRIVVGTR